jgi:hypothetical protein
MDGGHAENAGAIFCAPGMAGMPKTQEQFSVRAKDGAQFGNAGAISDGPRSGRY